VRQAESAATASQGIAKWWQDRQPGKASKRRQTQSLYRTPTYQLVRLLMRLLELAHLLQQEKVHAPLQGLCEGLLVTEQGRRREHLVWLGEKFLQSGGRIESTLHTSELSR